MTSFSLGTLIGLAMDVGNFQYLRLLIVVKASSN